MVKFIRLFCAGALIFALCASVAACTWEPFVPDDPGEVGEIKVRAGISDDEFCSYLDIENIHKTIPIVNRYINNLSGNLDAEQKAQALVALFKSFDGVTGARLYRDEYMRTPAVFFSFMDGQTDRELILDFSSTGKVLSYHYNVVTGAYVRLKRNITIDRVFAMINSLGLETDDVRHETCVSNMPSSEERLQRILDGLNAKGHTDDGKIMWRTSGYLHYQTGKITIFPNLSGMHNREYQTKWLAAMREYGLTESFDYEHSGHSVDFVIPEDRDIPEKHWTDILAEYNDIEVFDMYYNRYTLADKTIEGGYEEGVKAIDSKISISPVEDYKSTPRTFQLYCATERAYSSGSNPIIVVTEQSGSTIDISFKGVAEIGMTADIGPARAYINLGALEEGSYTFNLHNGDAKQTGRLVVTADSYTVEMPDNDTFAVSPKQLNRIPENTIWGIIGYHKETTSPLVDSFLDDMVAQSAVKKKFRPGDYREFFIDEKGDIIPYPEALYGYWFDRLFIFGYSGDLAKIDRLVEQYARAHKDKMSISIYTDKGERFLSWMYDRQ